RAHGEGRQCQRFTLLERLFRRLADKFAITLRLLEGAVLERLAVLVLDHHAQRRQQPADRAGEVDYRAVHLLFEIAAGVADEVSADECVLAVERLWMTVPLHDDASVLLGFGIEELQGDQLVVLDDGQPAVVNQIGNLDGTDASGDGLAVLVGRLDGVNDTLFDGLEVGWIDPRLKRTWPPQAERVRSLVVVRTGDQDVIEAFQRLAD